MYNIYDKLWGDDITNSLIWIFIRTGQEMFSEKMWNFKMLQLPYFLSDFHHFCTNLWGNFYSFIWNYVNSGLDFPLSLFFQGGREKVSNFARVNGVFCCSSLTKLVPRLGCFLRVIHADMVRSYGRGSSDCFASVRASLDPDVLCVLGWMSPGDSCHPSDLPKDMFQNNFHIITPCLFGLRTCLVC